MRRSLHQRGWPALPVVCAALVLIAVPLAGKAIDGPPKYQPSPEEAESGVRPDARVEAIADAPVAADLFFDSHVSRDPGRGDQTVLRTRYIELNASLFAAVPSYPGVKIAEEAEPLSGGLVGPMNEPPVGPSGGGPSGEAGLADPIRASLSFFDGQTHVVAFDKFERGALGSVSWFGKVEDVEDSEATLVILEGVMAGSFRLGEEFYQLRYAGNGVHALEQVDPTAFPEEAEPIRVDPEVTLPDESAPGDTGRLIDVLVVYTADARSAAGGTTAAIQARIVLGINETNQAYADGGVAARVRLVHAREIAYTETGNSLTDLQRLRGTSDGHMDSVHGLRNTYGADLVQLIVDSLDACGRAYFMGTVSTSFRSNAFGVTAEGCISPNYSFMHEMGHNQGLGHDRYVDTGNSPYPYAKGYVNQDAFLSGAPTSTRWRTVMAYNSQCAANGFGCTRLKRFSNPNQFYNGDRMGSTGSGSGPTGPADAVRTLNNTDYTVAHFKSATQPANTAPYLPNAAITDTTPRFWWRPADGAEWYRLWVLRDGESSPRFSDWKRRADTNCSTGHESWCYLDLPVTLSGGGYRWWVRTARWDGSQFLYGDWVGWENFWVITARPGIPTALTPDAATTDTTPRHTWTARRDATWYSVYILKDGASSPVLWKNYSKTETNCYSGFGSCYIDAPSLSGGGYRWWVRAWNPTGWGSWSSPKRFWVITAAPGTPVALTPNAVTADTTPRHVWTARREATWYSIYILKDGASSPVLWKNYTRTQANCYTGIGNCYIDAPTLTDGGYRWWARAWNPVGWGSWSSPRSFWVASTVPGRVTQRSPSGAIRDTTPTYTWLLRRDASYYALYVLKQGGTKPVLFRAYSAKDANCSTRTGLCMVTQPTALTSGIWGWWVRAWNPNGWGAWTGPMRFSLP